MSRKKKSVHAAEPVFAPSESVFAPLRPLLPPAERVPAPAAPVLVVAETAPRERIEAAPNPVLALPGCVEVLSHNQIAGWAWDPQTPDEVVAVDIYDGTQLLMRVRADVFREDLRAAGIGNGRHGFAIGNPGALLPLARHWIAVRRASDGVDLQASPQWLLRPEAGFDASLTQFLESTAAATASVARWAEDLDQQLALTLRALNHLLDARSSLDDDRPPLSDPRLQDVLQQAAVSDWMRELLVKVEAEYAPLVFERAESPLVSVIIPVYNKFRTTYNCLKSIIEQLPKASFEIIIADDCSHDETLFAGFLLAGGVRFVRNAKNQGFVRTCNAGAALARGKYLLFLNNDTLVRANWLDELVATFDAVPNVGIVGSKLLFEDGLLQEVGGVIWRLGDGWNWGRGGDPNDPRYCFLRDSDYVSGAALMIERELFEQLRGFDEHFLPAYYEDADLCFRVRATGKRVVVQPASEIVHLEGVSAGKDVHGGGMKRFQLINHRKFYERWKEALATHRFNGEQPELEAERTVKRRALFIDSTVLTPDQDAGSVAALNHILALVALGYKVTFLSADNMAKINPYTLNLQKLGIECLYHPYYGSVEEIFRRLSVKPDLVYLHRFVNASKYGSLVRQYFPECYTLYNVADLHSLRQQRELAVVGAVSGEPRVSEDAELAAMRQVNAVIVHSAAEAAILSQKAPEVRVHVVPWTVLPRPSPLSFERRSGYAFVGSYGHPPNLDAAKYLAHEIAPLLNGSERINGSELGIVGFLVGSNPPPQLTALEAQNIKVLGHVPDLTGLLHRLRCTAAPLRYGAGLKGKVLESLAHGLPCVMTEVAAEGMELPPELEWLIAHTPQEFARKLATVHEDRALNETLTAHGLEFIRSRYSSAATQRLLAAAMVRT
jgi:GT2 family glycosyltransferase/glycosyltransferase involved in cell wall biosynthesis